MFNPKGLVMKTALFGALALAFSAASAAAAPLPRAEDSKFYLFYNVNSGALENEIGLTRRQVVQVFDDQFGQAAEQIPLDVRLEDFYVARYPDQSYVFILKAPFNCAQEGCAAQRYTLDADGDLYYEDFSFPVKCKDHEFDKQLCIKGGYRPEATPKTKVERTKSGKKIIHYLAPKTADLP